MCTLTWWRGEGGTFEVYFNRDELKTRSRAEVPREYEESGVRFLSPRDPDGGGTWMLANEHGVVLCLLNRWHEERAAEQEWRSRGQLVWGLAGVRSVAELGEALAAVPLQTLKPFSLWAFDDKKSFGMDWSDGVLAAAEDEMPVTSSSYRYEEVAAARKETYARMNPSGPDGLVCFQGSVGEGASAHSVRMCRPDAQTMSRSRIRVDWDGVCWDYFEEQPNLAGAPEATVVTLSRD